MPKNIVICCDGTDRMDKIPDYRPINPPTAHSIEEGPSPPVADIVAGPENPPANPQPAAPPGSNPGLPG
jgi:hypothetical protein